jgi:hypothetical protein
MQSIERNGFTRDQIINALHGRNSTRTIKFRYDLLDKFEGKKGTLSSVESAEINMSAFSDIKRSARFILQDDGGIDWLNDRIQPFMLLQIGSTWVEWPLGVFLLSTPSKKEKNQKVYREIEAYDGIQVLMDDKLDARLTKTSGTNYITAIKEILQSAGITKINIQDKTSVLAITKEWAPGSSKLQIINELLEEINYTQLWVDENGYYTSFGYVSPSIRAPEYTYRDNYLSVMYGGVTDEVDLFSVPNKWVVTASNPERPPLVATYTNSNPSSITSTVSRGRTITDARSVDNIADQASLNAYVNKIAFEASQVMGYVTFETALMPFHSYSDVIEVVYSHLGISGKYSEVSWTMPLVAGGRMLHKARKVVSI